MALQCFSGCIFSPHKDTGGEPPPTPPVYPILSDPFNVMYAYKTAYEHRDSTKMEEIYDDNYQGESIDQSNPGSIEHLFFDKATEVSSVGAMAKAFTISNVTLQLPPALLRETDLSDPPGWAMINLGVSTVHLEVSDGGTTRFIESNKESFIFKFIPATPDSTSPTDTTWKIVRWSEIRY